MRISLVSVQSHCTSNEHEGRKSRGLQPDVATIPIVLQDAWMIRGWMETARSPWHVSHVVSTEVHRVSSESRVTTCVLWQKAHRTSRETSLRLIASMPSICRLCRCATYFVVWPDGSWRRDGDFGDVVGDAGDDCDWAPRAVDMASSYIPMASRIAWSA